MLSLILSLIRISRESFVFKDLIDVSGFVERVRYVFFKDVDLFVYSESSLV